MSWEMRKLSEVASLVRGVTFSKAEGVDRQENGRVPVIRAGSIQKTLLVNNGQIWVPQEKVKPHQLIKENDILMCTSSGSSDLVGKCAKSDADYDVSFGAFCAGIRPDLAKVSPSYLYHFLCSPTFKNWTKNSSGANIKNIRASELAEFKIPLPPLEEQKRIAAILDKADAIRQKRKQSIALADEFLRSVFLEMFGDPVTNTKGWVLGSMADFGGFKNGLNYSRDENGVELSYIGVGDFKSHSKLDCIENLSKIQLNENPDDGYLLKDNDILFVRSNGNKALVGRCLTVHPGKHKVTFSGFCIRYRVQKIEELNPTFLNYCMRIPSMKNAMLKGGQGANIQNINQKTLTGLMFPIPPIELQKDFESLVSRYQVFIERALDGANNDTALFASLSQKAFSGQL
ncbi:restriction endonuclease subunit S [Vibrio vulnificus]|nr:hypothetical protein [Vibrio vulnificus]MCU8109718.1 restriction endonuclease subunit S [Vibrio vulnificus]